MASAGAPSNSMLTDLTSATTDRLRELSLSSAGGPPLRIGLPYFLDGIARGVVMAQPPVRIALPTHTGGQGIGIIVAQPPLTTRFSNP